MLVAIYYAVKIVRLSDDFDYVALKGGRAPYYIVVGLVFLLADRVLDLLTNSLSRSFGYQLTVTLNDPPGALAGFFIALGLREMYVVYIRNAQRATAPPPHQEIWKIEETEAEPTASSRSSS